MQEALKGEQQGGYTGTYVAGEVVEAQHHDEDHRCHRVLRGHQAQPEGQSRSAEHPRRPLDSCYSNWVVLCPVTLGPRNFSQLVVPSHQVRVPTGQ